MYTSFTIVSRFLAAHPGGIRGRNSEAVPAELEDLLRRFVAGNLSEDEMLDLYRELRGNEYAMEMLATLLQGG